MVARANHNIKDASFVKTIALGTADATVVTVGMDLGALTARGARLEDCELLIEAPALDTTQLPNGDTNTYSIETDDDVAFGSAKIVANGVIIQTGAGGVGAAAATARFKIPSDCERYIRVKSILAGGTGDCSGVSMTASLLF
ncbi:MAG: hypothetical protein JW741_25460 [Sedimentisphaerales bacterium]|nr:hypothetical protein [Sedimentisphaerales bacterium]